MGRDPLIEVHEAADEAQKRLEPFGYRVGKGLLGAQHWVVKQFHRFRHSLSLFGMAAILILVLTTKDLGNLVPVVAMLVVLVIIWM